MYTDRLWAAQSRGSLASFRVYRREPAKAERTASRRVPLLLGFLAAMMHRRHGFLTSTRTDEREVSVFRLATISPSQRTDIAVRTLLKIYGVGIITRPHTLMTASAVRHTFVSWRWPHWASGHSLLLWTHSDMVFSFLYLSKRPVFVRGIEMLRLSRNAWRTVKSLNTLCGAEKGRQGERD